MGVRTAVTLSALCSAIAGAILLFAPDEASRVLIPGSGGPILVQLLGAAFLGFGSANWIARGDFCLYGAEPCYSRT